MTRVIMPDGTTGKAAPEDLDGLILSGARTFNPDMEVDVKLDPFSSDTIKVKGSDLQDYLKKGYTTQRAQQYEAENEAMRQYQRSELENIGNTGVETALGTLSSVASGITMGGSDILTRGAYEIQDLFTGKDEAEANAKELLELRKRMGWVDTAAQAAGALGTAIATGGLSTLGKGAMSKVGLSALEGALGGAGMTAGQQALGDESINAEAYAMNVGLGGLIGGLGGGLVEGIAKAASKTAPKAVSVMDVDFGDLSKVKSATTLQQTVPIMVDGKMIGTAELSRGVQGYHPGVHGTGITLEAVQLASDAPKDSMLNVMRQLTDEFGLVTSPSTPEALASLKSDFAKFGVKKSTQTGDEWFAITPTSIPAQVTESQNALKVSKLLQSKGATPEEKALIEKIYSPENSGLRKSFVEFAENKESAVTSVRKNFEDFSKATKEAVSSMEKAQEGVASTVTQDGALKMKSKLIGVQEDAADSISNLSASKLTGDDTAVSLLKRFNDNIDRVVRNTEPESAWRDLLMVKRDMLSSIKSARKRARASGGFSEDAEKAFDDTYNSIKSTLESDEVVGEGAAALLTDLNRKSAISLQAEKNFKKAFYTKDANEKYFLDNTKIRKALETAHNDNNSLTVIDSVVSDFSAFHDSLSRAQSAGYIKDARLPDIKALLPTLSEVNKYREFAGILNILQSNKAASGAGRVASTALEMTGSAAGGFTGYYMAKGAGAIGDSLLGKTPLAALGSATAGMKLAQRATETIDRVTGLAANAITAGAKAAIPISRVALIKSIGAKQTSTSDHDGYINSVRQRMEDLSKPESLSQISGTLAHPEQEKAIEDAAKKAFTYALSQLPKTSSYSKQTGIAAKKVDKLLLAVVKPMEALEKAVYEGDTDTIKHVQSMYPKMFEIFQSSMIRQLDAMPNLTYQKRVHIQKLTGIPYRNISNTAFDAAQSVFQAEQQPAPKGKSIKITNPDLPPGEAIQSGGVSK
jgi:hypothetical protein